MDDLDVVDQFIADAAKVEADTLPPRLLDSDPSKYRSLKQVVVIGRPGSGIDGVGDALKKLGFKVYDFKAASDRYERDFPLWLEAARLRREGRPYSQSDYDKVIGDHNALVGAPTCFFDHDFVKLYPNVKVIMVTRVPNAAVVKDMLQRNASPFWQSVDPVYRGNIEQFLTAITISGQDNCVGIDERAVRDIVRQKNLLVIHNLIAWVPLCQFLGVPVPDAQAPELHDNTVKSELAARPQRAISEKVNKASRRIIMGIKYSSMIASAILVSVLAVLFGNPALRKSWSSSLQFFNYLVAQSQIRDMTRLLALEMASLTLVCGFLAGFWLASICVCTTTVVERRRDFPRKYKDGRKKGKQGRGRQADNDENKRPERETVPEWSGVQDTIRKDDAEKHKERKATFQAWRDGKQVTFHVTHKRTEGGQVLSSGPRKILSVTEETVE